MKAAEAWRILRIGTEGDSLSGVATLDTAIDSKWGRPRFALGSMQQARLLVPVLSLRRAEKVPSSDAMQVRVLPLVVGGQTVSFLDLQCMDPALEPVFGDVVDEILARISAGREPVAAVARTLEDFRDLLAASGAREVSLSKVAGLVAELLILNRLLDRSPEAWRCWAGPLGDRHDFRRERLSLEVKCSSRLSSRTITISSVEQLEPLHEGELYLAYHVLERVPNGELSVASLADRALARASSATELRLRLNRIGCPDPADAEWNRYSFQLASQHFYRVEGNFPRLVPSMIRGGCLPAGVVSLEYQIEVSALQPHEIGAEEFERLTGRIAA